MTDDIVIRPFRPEDQAAVGTLILLSLREATRAKGYGQIVPETTSTWDDAVTFYQRRGFRITGSHDGDTHFMLDLNSPSP
ncbi:MAG: hypothetical protein JW850_01835 [Thermoflexales bacterium]|nr:hypothetical protein [Thermoflexales bacterium]